MRQIASESVNPMMPLSKKDTAALDEIFEKVELEVIGQIEATVIRYPVVPPDPWEEKGWVINSYLPTVSLS